MQFIKVSYIIILVIYTLFLIYFCFKNGRFIRTLLLSALSGVLTFTVVNFLSIYSGVGIAVNWWTLGTSSLFGMPGVLGLLTVRMFF